VVETASASPRESVGNLPVALTSLVGRHRELRDLRALLGTVRLLALTGTGGSGKTRLGLALATACHAEFSGGAWWVDLAGVTGKDLIAGTVAAALAIPQTPGQDTAAAVIGYLKSRVALVVFDNCEQVVVECARLIEHLLSSCPGLTIVATSREVLGVPGEHVFRVDGLRLPSADDDDAAEAVELFLERARAFTPDFSVGPGDRAAVAKLCRQLDGLPLAIELAAARAGILGVAEISRRLRGDARILRNPSRMAPQRHQTLEATLDWSYRLLSDEEQALFRRLACFSGSFSLSAAEAVSTDRQVRTEDVAGLVAALVGKSLVLAAGTAGEYRFRMLETIRQYGAQKLRDSGEEPGVREAHARYYLSLAERAHAGLEGPEQARWLGLLELEHDNLRAAMADREIRTSARLAALMWPFWYRRGYYHEARVWLERAVDAVLTQPVAPSDMAAVFTGAGVLAFLQCDYVVAAERLTKARTLCEEEGDQVGLATTLQRLGSIAREEGRYADAKRLHEESLEIWTALGDATGVAASQDYLGFAAWLSGDGERAAVLCDMSVRAFRAAGLRQETAAALINQGVAVWMAGDAERGAALLEMSLDIAMRLGYQEGIAWALNELAVIISDDDPATAGDMLAESLEIHARLGDRWRIASVVEAIAELAASSSGPGDPQMAAALAGGASALRRSLGAPLPPAERPAYDRCLHLLRDRLGARGFHRAWQQGEQLEMDELVSHALHTARVLRSPAALDGSAGRRPLGPEAAGYGLTERELDVLGLLSQGLTNREIGRQLLISTGTAGVHVSNILRKLGVSSRVQAAGIAHRLGLT
jgi:predicted ATPase/DNA-binding CsgD family transcriptional regulator